MVKYKWKLISYVWDHRMGGVSYYRNLQENRTVIYLPLRKKISVSLRYPIETQDRNVICHFFTTVFLPFGDCYRGMGWVYHGLRRKHHPPAYPKNSKQPWVRIVHSSGKLWHMLIDCPNLNKANLVMSSFTKHKFGSIVPKSFYFPDLHAVCMYLWVSEWVL